MNLFHPFTFLSFPCIFYRKRNSAPEDVEYFEMQQEMNEDIQKQYQKVERIIGIYCKHSVLGTGYVNFSIS